MYEQSARDPILAGTCARCGTKVSGRVSSCPNCGAPARFIFGENAPARKPARATPGPANGRAHVPHQQPLRPSRPTHAFASNDSVYPDYPDEEVRPPPPRRASRRGVKKGAVLAVVAAIVLVSGAVLLHWYEGNDAREPQMGSITTQGDVTSNATSQPSQTPITPAPAPTPTTTQQGPTIAQGSQPTMPIDK